MYCEYSEKSQVWFVYNNHDWVVASFADKGMAERYIEEQV
jgi:hypothetical protein